ncbi:MAG: alpha/beta fold hydrolase [Pseudomonadota bacterium]|nr:alpha/beta fold hydrolase [Pseudomonadota bacterium]
MAAYVLVHGATAGGWIWPPVPELLRRQGHTVHAPTLTGLGERSHLLRPDIDLNTHITDIVNVFRFEDLRDALLVGHSYGGAVIAGVAERIPERIRRLIYLDALIPEDGQAVKDLYPPDIAELLGAYIEAGGDGWRYPPPEPRGDARFVDHPAAAMFQPLRLNNPRAREIPRAYIYCTDKSGAGPQHQGIVGVAARVRAAGWPFFELATGHHPMHTAPEELVRLLLSLQ